MRYIDPTGELFIFNLGGGLLGAVSGGVGGYIASGGDSKAALYGALSGGLVGAFNPLGAFAGGVFSNTLGQFIGNYKNPCKDILDFNGQLIVASGFAGAIGSRLASYLASPSRSAFTHHVNQRLGSSPLANGVGGALAEGALGGAVEGLAGESGNANNCGKCGT